MKCFISLEEAIEILDKNVSNLACEELELIDAINRISAERVFSQIDNPPFDKSAMDGYGIKFEDSIGCNKVKVIGDIFAGNYFKAKVELGIAVKIMTGAMIPKGVTAVIKQEDITSDNDYIILNKEVKKGENICLKGEDILEGTLLLDKKKKLNYADIGIMASVGINKLLVYKRPKVALISTGSEIIDIDESLDCGKIYNSNKYSLLARIRELGYEIIYIKHVIDDAIGIGRCIEELSAKVDLIITTGGASVGEKDLLKDAIDIINGEKLFWKIKIKPGSAVLCSLVNKAIVISLSGNPTAALTTFELLVKPTLEKLEGQEGVFIKRERAFLVEGFSKENKQRRFIRGNFINEEGKVNVYITQVKSGNGILSSNLNSNCIIEVDKNISKIEKNTLVNIIKL